MLLFAAWQLWIGDMIYGSQNNAAGQALSQEWAAQSGDPTAPSEASATPSPTADSAAPVAHEPIVMSQPGSGEDFGVMHIPRFGSDYAVRLAGGVETWESLDVGAIGHYPDTAMPGDVGNFAVAGHRGSHGAPFMDLPGLRVGDAVVIETADGWYTYRYRNMEYVSPNAVEVLLPVPQEVGVEANGRYITMTTCSPRFGSAERLIAYGVFEQFTPRADGPPASLAAVA